MVFTFICFTIKPRCRWKWCYRCYRVWESRAPLRSCVLDSLMNVTLLASARVRQTTACARAVISDSIAAV